MTFIIGFNDYMGMIQDWLILSSLFYCFSMKIEKKVRARWHPGKVCKTHVFCLVL